MALSVHDKSYSRNSRKPSKVDIHVFIDKGVVSIFVIGYIVDFLLLISKKTKRKKNEITNRGNNRTPNNLTKGKSKLIII